MPHHCGDLKGPTQPGGSKKDCFKDRGIWFMTRLLLLKEAWGGVVK